MSAVVDHLVVGSADLDVGIRWVADRLGVAPVFGGVHDGFGTRNALLGLGEQYLEVLSLDPAQGGVSSSFRSYAAALTTPALVTLAIAKSGLQNPVRMSRVRADRVRLEWEVEFTSTPLFFIDWKDCPRPSGLPDGGRITSLTVTTPEPSLLDDVEDVTVREGPWHIEAAIDGKPLA